LLPLALRWRAFFKDLKTCRCDGSKVRLGIMDGLTGFEDVFKEEFSLANVQRCQVHEPRNILAKVPKKLKEIVANNLRGIEKVRKNFPFSHKIADGNLNT
jgi:transposase-like protein